MSVQNFQVKLTNPLGILFCRLTEGNGQNQAIEAFRERYMFLSLSSFLVVLKIYFSILIILCVV